MCKTSPCFGLDEAFWGGRDKLNGSQGGKDALIALKSSTPLLSHHCPARGRGSPIPILKLLLAPLQHLALQTSSSFLGL